MGRKETRALKSIKAMYASQKLDSDMILHKTKLLLAVYRDVVWHTIKNSELLCEDIEGIYYGHELSKALAYLTDFAPEEERHCFEERISTLFETKWMIDLIDKAMYKIYEYYNNGKLYHEILSKTYLVSFKYTESELLEILNIERSTYYDRKKEAVLLFGVALWGYAIPQMKGIFKEHKYLDGIPSYFK
ncbi:MAG: hypothetical protein ACRCW1_03780 [Anaerotignaceae bacterium]